MASPTYFRLRQICLVADALPPVVHAMHEVLGLSMCYQDPHVTKYGLENALFPVGTDFIEVVVPTRPDTTAGRFIEKSEGWGAYMAIFDCSDPDARAESARCLSVRVANVIDHPGFHGVQLHPKDCRAAMVEFDRSEGAADGMGYYYPAGGTGWPAHIRTDRSQRMTHIVVQSLQPADLALHWSRLLQTPLQGEADQGLLTTDAMAIRFAGAPAGTREAVMRIGLAVTGKAAMLQAAERHGLPVRDSAFALAGVWFDLTEPTQ